MSHYLSNDKDRVVCQMYPGRAVGISFPRDGNKHHEEWTTHEVPVVINGLPSKVAIRTYADGSLIAVEVDLPEGVTCLSSHVK